MVHLPPRRSQRSIAVLAGVALAGLPFGVPLLAPATASAASAPAFTLQPNAIDVVAGQATTITANYTSARPKAVRWSVSGLPSTVSTQVACRTTKTCTVSFTAAPDAKPVTVLATLSLGTSRARRNVAFALHVDGRTAPPITVAPPPTTAAPPAPAPTQPSRTFTVRTDQAVASTRPGGRATFGVIVSRAGWTGPVDLTIENLPANWRAAFQPNPATGNDATMILDTAANTAPGDYAIRFNGRNGASTSSAAVVVRVRTPQPSVTVQTSPAAAPGSSTRFLIDARSIDDPSAAVTVTVENLPAGITAAVSPNPVNGAGAIDFSVAPTVAVGNYAFNIAATRGGVTVRTPAVLQVVPRTVTGAAYAFMPTATSTPGANGYTLRSSTATPRFTRGVASSVDIVVAPTGGFSSPISFTADVPATWMISWSTPSANVVRLTVTVPSTAPAGTFPVTVRAASGTLSASVRLDASIA